MSADDLMARIEQARNSLESARQLVSQAQEILGIRDEPPPPQEPEKRGFWDKAWGAVSDHGHTALDLAGFLPGLGTVADLANAAWYTAEGDYKNAAFSAASAIPGAGDAAAAARLGARGMDAAQGIRRGADAVDTAEGVAEGIEQAEQGNYGNAASAVGSAAFGAGGGRGRNSDSGNGRSGSDGGRDDDKYDEYAEQYGYGDDYEDPRARDYGDMGKNQREKRQFNDAQRAAERRAGRELTPDERQEIHHRDPADDGKYRSYQNLNDEFDEFDE